MGVEPLGVGREHLGELSHILHLGIQLQYATRGRTCKDNFKSIQARMSTKVTHITTFSVMCANSIWSITGGGRN